MNFHKALPLLAVFGLAACNMQTAGFQTKLPENVLAIAGPNQDLSSARLREADNCYWYDHKNAVETTQLPLRSTEGRHICVAKDEAEA